MTKRLSKSKIISGLQCEKRLWLEIHKPELIETPEHIQRIFDVGNEVNDIARSLHKNGQLIEFDEGIPGALAETEKVLKETPNKTLFEATFTHENVAVRVDILKKNARGYRLIEVKSAASVKEPNYADCAVQAWALEGCGLPVERVELAHIDGDFVYGGDGDYRGLFWHEDLTDDIAERKREMPGLVNGFQDMLAGEEPDIDTGDHCRNPYQCPFIEHCAGPGVDYPVTCLPRGRRVAAELIAEGIDDIRDIPDGHLDNETHAWVRDVTVRGKPDLKPQAKKELDAYAWPRYYLDFETANFAIPVWKDTSPYKQYPFQWSCHRETKSGEITHQEFLDTTGDSPMRKFTESLLQAVGKRGSILVYTSFEEGCLKRLAERFPDLAPDIAKVIARLADLYKVAMANYYHPDMRGSWSLKKVLPTVAPSLDYGDLGEVQDGNAAGAAYREIIRPDTEPQRAQSLTNDMLAYCKRDTEALIALAHFFYTGKLQ